MISMLFSTIMIFYFSGIRYEITAPRVRYVVKPLNHLFGLDALGDNDTF